MINKIAVLANNIGSFTGLTNFLRRMGAGFACSNKLANLNLDGFDILFIAGNFIFKDSEIKNLKHWAEKDSNRKIIISEYSNIISDVFDSPVSLEKPESPYWPLSIDFKGKKALVSFPKYSCLKFENNQDLKYIKKHRLFITKGDFLRPEFSIFDKNGAEFLIYQFKNYIALTVPVFKILGDIFLGQMSIENFKNWQNPLFCLDEFILNLKEIIEDALGTKINVDTNAISDNDHRGTIVLRHDVDSSRDISYLEYELENKIPATYALLVDKNTKFWLSKLRNKPDIEISFHYNTVDEGSIFTKIANRSFKNESQYKPFIKGITGSGLYRQYLKAKSSGIYAETLNRHGPFIVLPDFYDAMEYLCRREPAVLGGGSLFRGIILEKKGGGQVYANGLGGIFPETFMPYWYPIKAFLKSGNSIERSKFWESTHLMETDPALIDLLLENKDSCVNKPVYSFGFHPAHARSGTFSKNGCFPWFEYLIKKARSLDFEFLTLVQLYRRMNEWEKSNVKYILD